MITIWLRVPDARVLVGSLVVFPFLYAAFPTSWFWNDGRYGIALAPIASLVGIGAIWQLARARAARWICVAILAAAVVSTVVAVDAGYGGFSNVSGLSDWRANPNTAVTALSAKLQALGIRDVYAGYWVAYDLAFVSAGRIQVAPIVNDRDPGESKAVAGAARVGWVFVPAARVGEVAGQVGSATGLDPGVVDEQTLASWMTANGVRFRTATVGPFVLVLPDQNSWPQALLGPGRPG
jgi:hypothetical protein